MQVFSSKANRRRAIALAVGGSLALIGLYMALRQYAAFVFDPTALRTWIGQFGVLAPAVFIVVQTLQVIMAPIPGQVMALVGGYLFGPIGGTVYSMTGVVTGSAIAFSISRKFGRPAVERLIHDDVIDRFDGFVDRVGLPGLLLFVVIPGLPDDALCFLAGLTQFRLRTFVVVIALGRLPAYVVTNFAGGRLASGHVIEGVLAIVAVVIVSVVGHIKREELKRFFGNLGLTSDR